MFSFFKRKPAPEHVEPTLSAVVAPEPSGPTLSAVIEAASEYVPPVQNAYFNGEKFAGGLGPVELLTTDYWTLRARSATLFKENLYARGLIRRLITNEINTGLTPEACPDESLLGLPEDSLDDWTDNVESRFALWGKNKTIVDYERRRTFGELERECRREALIDGDVLVVLRPSQVTGLPQVQLVSGGIVQTPFGGEGARQGNEIKQGVELDPRGRHVAFWIKQADGSAKRLAAFGERSGRRVAWLVYGTDKRKDEVRGEPLLSLVLQSLKEVDRYRDSAQRKAVINSILAMFIKKDVDKAGTLPMSGGAVARGAAPVTDADGSTRELGITQQVPGVIAQELQQGETPMAFGSDGTDVQFGPFEEAIIQAVAWANEMPPEILRLAFSNNYSASQAAINEFKIYLNLRWMKEAEDFCGPIYEAWLLAEVMRNRIKAAGMLDAWRDPEQYAQYGSWIDAQWNGSVKPSTDMLKQAKGSQILVAEGWSTNAREARALTGTKASRNLKRLKKENREKVEAMRPLAEFKAEFGEEPDEMAARLEELDESGET